MGYLQTIDDSILSFIQNNMRTEFFDWLFPIITALGDAGILWIVVGVVLLAIKKYRRCGIAMLMALVLCLLVGNITLKPWIARIRPFEANGVTELLIAMPHDFSFPSGHSMASFAGATVLAMNYRKVGIAALLLAALIAFSRLYLYVHYPTDVLAGALIGVGLAVLSVYVVKKLDKKS